MEFITHTAFIDKWMLQIYRCLFAFAVLLSIALGGYLVLGGAKSSEGKKASFSIEKEVLGQGLLALNSCREPLILQELLLVGVNTRPDQDRQFSLALRSTGEQKIGTLGETIFLQQVHGTWMFSTEPELSLTPYSVEGTQLLCKLNNDQAVLTPSSLFLRPLAHESYVEALKKGTAWGTDVFLAGWGGDEYRNLTQKVKVAIGPSVYFLNVGDCLYWNGEKWTEDPSMNNFLILNRAKAPAIELSERGEVSMNTPPLSDNLNPGALARFKMGSYSLTGPEKAVGPIAQLVRGSSQGVDFQVWDETGFSSEKIHLAMESSPKTSFKMDELMTAIRPRTASEITCQLGKRRVILKEGDWWIRTDRRWKPVRTAADLEACLHHQIAGELFIFEKIETTKGKVTLKGQAFDRMRTFSEPVSLTVHTEKKLLHLAEKPSQKSSVPLAKKLP